MDKDYSDLVASPYDDDPPRGRRVWAVVIGVLGLSVGLGVVWWFTSASDPDEALTATESTTTVTQLSEVPLVGWVTDPQLLVLPTRMPEGFEVCGSALYIALCNPQLDGAKIVVAVSANAPVDDTSSTGIDGVRWVGGSDTEIAIVFPYSGVVYTAEGLSGPLLRDIVASVPIASSDWIVLPDEPPLGAPLERAFVADLLGIPEDQVDNHGSGYWGVTTRDLGFGYTDTNTFQGGVAELKSALNQSAMHLRDPVSTSDDRPLLVGFDPNGSRWRAEWVQRGKWWFLDASNTAVPERSQFEELVARIEKEIAEVP